MKLLWIILAWISLTLGVVGAILPILPTTPFVLLAAFLFSKGSPKLYQWLISHRLFGPPIRDWQAGLGISLKAKIMAIIMMWVSILYSANYHVPIIWVKVLLVIVAIGVSMFLIKTPTKSI